MSMMVYGNFADTTRGGGQLPPQIADPSCASGLRWLTDDNTGACVDVVNNTLPPNIRPTVKHDEQQPVYIPVNNGRQQTASPFDALKNTVSDLFANKTLVYGAAGIAAYMLFFRKKKTTRAQNPSKRRNSTPIYRLVTDRANYQYSNLEAAKKAADRSGGYVLKLNLTTGGNTIVYKSRKTR